MQDGPHKHKINDIALANSNWRYCTCTQTFMLCCFNSNWYCWCEEPSTLFNQFTMKRVGNICFTWLTTNQPTIGLTSLTLTFCWPLISLNRIFSSGAGAGLNPGKLFWPTSNEGWNCLIHRWGATKWGPCPERTSSKFWRGNARGETGATGWT